jgi:hypothetical protein
MNHITIFVQANNVLFKSKVFIYCLGVISLLLVIFESNELLLLLLYLFSVSFGFLLYDKVARHLFFLSYSLLIIILPFLIDSYINVAGQPFIPGGDAEMYYNRITSIAQGNNESYYGRYKLFLKILSSYYKVILYLGGSISYYYFFFFSMFVGANLSPLLYKIGKGFFSEKVLISGCILTCLFPGLIQVATNSWRESLVYTPFLLSIYLAININRAKNLILYFLTFMFLANIRLEIGVISLTFFVLFNFVFLNKKELDWISLMSSKLLLLLLLLTVIFFAFQNGLFEYLKFEKSSSLSYQMGAYTEMSNETTDDNSISNTLRNAGLIGRFLLFFYTLFAPIPPPGFFQRSFTFYNLFISIGAIFWYFLMPIAVIGMLNNFKKYNLSSFTKSFFISFVLGIIIISLTSIGTQRHKLYLYPILFLYAYDYLEVSKSKTKAKLILKILLFYAIGLTLYLFWKIN